MSAPVGAAGCSATAVAQEPRPFSLGLSYGWSETKLIFTNNERYRVRQAAYSLSFVATLDSGTVLAAAVGPHIGGEISGLRGVEESWTIRPGALWSLTLARRFFGSKPQIPFMLVVGTFSGSHTSTERASDGERRALNALDAKADVSVGWTLGDAWSPYLAVRAFGGPVFWRQDDARLLGTDLYHVSVATGFNLTVGNRVSAFFDGAFVGLRGLSGGFSVRF